MDLTKAWVYDIETYKELFSFSIVRADGKHKVTYEISRFKNDFQKFIRCIDYLRDNDCWMIGFNNVGFDYPIIHKVYELKKTLGRLEGIEIADRVFGYAQEQIESGRGEGFANTIAPDRVHVKQIDLYKIHHFDNKAKSTSLKMIEFNSRSHTIEDLPYGIHEELDEEKIKKILLYNEHDVEETRKFAIHTLPMIEFREQLTETYSRDFMNHNDTKIGKDFFIMKLEEEGVPVYKIVDNRKVVNQSKRSIISLKDAVFDYYNFTRPEFQAVLEWFKSQHIVETKGVFSDIPEHKLGPVAQYAELTEKRKKFKGEPTEVEITAFKKKYPMGWIEEVELKSGKNKKSYWMHWNIADNLNVVVDGFRFDFGTGGIHGSITTTKVKETSRYKIVDADVASMYPNIAIANEVYPEHLTKRFCPIYKFLYEERKKYPKGTAENAMLKLALNGTYGETNNQYSAFYDPLYTMKITINGQLSLCLLADMLLQELDIKIIAINTDGITVALNREQNDDYYRICKEWEGITGLQLEYADYSRMWVRDVNNYIAEYTNGKLKRKGAYEYKDLGWHQNQSALVVQKAVEAHLVRGESVEEFIKNHDDIFDFMLRVKVPRSSKLVLVNSEGEDVPQQNICRYYPCKTGGKLIKIMPPLPDKEEYRRLGIDVDWNVQVCNDMDDFKGDIDYDYYINEANKLIF